MEKTNSIMQLSSRKFISRALTVYFEKKFTVAIWRLPDSQVFHLTASEHPLQSSDIILEELKPGFLFSPFHPAKEKIYLPADEFYSFQSDQIISAQGKYNDEIQSHWNHQQPSLEKHTAYYTAPNHRPPIITEQDFHKLVTFTAQFTFPLADFFSILLESTTPMSKLPA